MVKPPASFSALPSVDRLLRESAAADLIEEYGRAAVTEAIRATLAWTRQVALADGDGAAVPDALTVLDQAALFLAERTRPSLRPVFNLTGTVVHTNFGRSLLPETAIEAVATIARSPSNLEYDLDKLARGERDKHLEAQLCRLTGAEAATVVNNNAAAVLLILNTLALRKEVPVSRGELIEIGGAFRMPDIMARAGCKLREVGTTNRTHLGDYASAIHARTGLVMKVHASNYSIEGFTAAPNERELAALCRERGVPFAIDLGSGTLVDLARYGLPHEPTASEALETGADLVTFSGDKLLGGPQAGIIVGRADLVEKLRRNPLKRALRVDRLTIAALAAVLALYHDPDRLTERVPTLRLLARPLAEIDALARRIAPLVAERLGGAAGAEIIDCTSQIGSGALPTQRLASRAIAIRPRCGRRGAGAALKRLASAFRALPVPVVGRIHDHALILDLRCLEDERSFTAQLARLQVP
jgi:L-seryl-tRNA(Ser) seleniumtransferase